MVNLHVSHSFDRLLSSPVQICVWQFAGTPVIMSCNVDEGVKLWKHQATVLHDAKTFSSLQMEACELGRVSSQDSPVPANFSRPAEDASTRSKSIFNAC